VRWVDDLAPTLPMIRRLGVGREFGKLDQATQWWVGDWWAFGEHHYGDRKALVESEDWSGPAFQTCADAASICRVFESSSAGLDSVGAIQRIRPGAGSNGDKPAVQA
jgi:hypothetical protein